VVLGTAPTATLISPCVEGSRNIANDQLVFRRGDARVESGLPRIEFRESPLGRVKPRALVGKRTDLQTYIAETARDRLSEVGDLSRDVGLQLGQPALVVFPPVGVHHKLVDECDQQRGNLHRLQQDDEAELPDDPRTRTGWHRLAHGEMLHWTGAAVAAAEAFARAERLHRRSHEATMPWCGPSRTWKPAADRRCTG
jgi:hypothetical protein